MTADDSFLGRGWNFGLRQDSTGAGVEPGGQIAEASGNEKIRQSIWLILSTAPGERVGRPDFGCGIHDLVFAPRTAATLGALKQAVATALQWWEPRIEVLGVDALPHPENSNGTLLEIHYEVRATHSRAGLVYPFSFSA